MKPESFVPREYCAWMGILLCDVTPYVTARVVGVKRQDRMPLCRLCAESFDKQGILRDAIRVQGAA